MKNFLIIPIVLLALNLKVNAQIFDLVEVRNSLSGTCTYPQTNHLKDSDGNTYYLTYEINSDEFEEYYLNKKDASGNSVWRVLTKAYTQPQITIDPSGYIYLYATEQYYVNPLLAKYRLNGTLVWDYIARAEEDLPGFAFLGPLRIDTEGNVLIGGSVTGSYVFGDFALTTARPLDSEIGGAFLVKFNSEGIVQWAKVGQSPDSYDMYASLNNIELDEQNNIYICGSLNTKTSFDGYSMIPTGREGSFIAKLNPSGEMQWANQLGGDRVNAQICMGNSGIIHVLGNYTYWGKYSVANIGEHVVPHPNACDTCEDVEIGLNIYARINQNLNPQILHRINAGGPEIADTEMNWHQDRQSIPSPYLDPSSSNHTTGTFYTWDQLNTTGAPKDIFGPNRYQISWGTPLAYNLPVEPGLYQVNLFFAEKPASPGVASAGQRVFDIEIENALRLEDLDIYDKANLNALKESFLVHSDELLEINFLKKVGNPQVNGLEIISLNKKDQQIPVLPLSTVNSVDQNNGMSVSESNGVIYIKLNQSLDQPSNLSLYNSSGQVYFEEQYSSANTTIEIPAHNLAAGLYLVKVAETTLKVVKQ